MRSIRGRGSAGQRQYGGGCHCRQVSAEVAEVADTAAMLARPIPAGLWAELKHQGCCAPTLPLQPDDVVRLTPWNGDNWATLT